MDWGKSLQRLRKLKEAVIPDGVERVGNYWFWDSGIESAEIPASVREIGIEAFCYCKNLRRLTFKKVGKKAPAPQSDDSRL